MINQKWVSKPGAIPHIQHFYQPQRAWLEWMEYQRECVETIYDFLNDKKPRHEDIEMSIKIDDRMSVKVAHPTEHTWAVGYKTGPLLETYDEIDDYYHDKPYVADKLRPLLDRTPQILGSQDVGVTAQMGFLAYDENGIFDKFKANIIEYDVENFPARMVLSAVSATRDGKFIPFFPTNGSFSTSLLFREVTKGICDLRIIKPIPLLRERNDDAIEKIEMILDMENVRSKTRDASFHVKMIKHIDNIKKFFNNAARDGRLYNNLTRHGTLADYLITNELLQGEAMDVDAALQETINQRLLSDYISQKVLNTDASIGCFLRAKSHEGLVFTKYLNKGEGAMIAKMVDPAYTKANFDMWSKK